EGSQRVREREEKEHDLGVLRKKVKGQIENTFGKADIGKTLRGQFYDDGGWWALAWLRVHDLFCRDGILPPSSCIDGGISIEPHSTPTSRSPYLQRAMDIFSHMAKNAWDEKQCKGGAWWSKANKYKNAITNELFLSIAARLHLALGDSASAVRFPLDLMLSPVEQQRKEAKEGRKTKQLTTMTQKPVHTALGWAQKSWWWLERSGMINAETGLINDGLLEDGSCKTNLGITWTYNQGVILSGLADLYEATKDKNYIKQATKLVQAVMKHLVHDNTEAKVLREPCENHPVLTCDKDQRQFKGIFVRHLRYLMDVAAEFRVLDSRNEAALREFLEGNAESVWSHARDERNNRFGLEWGELRVSHRDATTQMAAIDALNSVMAL
ncbi:Mannan endo-1,6-alpha-mannosidase, partial [Balamuthia mandrillaris]